MSEENTKVSAAPSDPAAKVKAANKSSAASNDSAALNGLLTAEKGPYTVIYNGAPLVVGPGLIKFTGVVEPGSELDMCIRAGSIKFMPMEG